MKFIVRILILAMLLCTLVPGVFAAEAPTEEDVLAAAESIIAAQREHYDIERITVNTICLREDGTYDCYFTLRQTLLARRVEDLPHIRGLLDGLGLESTADIPSLSESGTIDRSPDYYTPGLVLALKVNDFISGVDMYIGEASEFNYVITLAYDENGQLFCLGMPQDFGGGYLPLSQCLPESVANMYQAGLDQAAYLKAEAAQLAEEFNRAAGLTAPAAPRLAPTNLVARVGSRILHASFWYRPDLKFGRLHLSSSNALHQPRSYCTVF